MLHFWSFLAEGCLKNTDFYGKMKVCRAVTFFIWTFRRFTTGCWGTALQSRKVAGSIPDREIGSFHWYNLPVALWPWGWPSL